MTCTQAAIRQQTIHKGGETSDRSKISEGSFILATKFTYNKRSGGKWDPRPGGPVKCKKIWDKMYSGGAQSDRERESTVSKSVWNSKNVASGCVSQVEKKLGSGYASKIKNISQINIKIKDKMVRNPQSSLCRPHRISTSRRSKKTFFWLFFSGPEQDFGTESELDPD
jgi:hypothetical protein